MDFDLIKNLSNKEIEHFYNRIIEEDNVDSLTCYIQSYVYCYTSGYKSIFGSSPSGTCGRTTACNVGYQWGYFGGIIYEACYISDRRKASGGNYGEARVFSCS